MRTRGRKTRPCAVAIVIVPGAAAKRNLFAAEAVLSCDRGTVQGECCCKSNRGRELHVTPPARARQYTRALGRFSALRKIAPCRPIAGGRVLPGTILLDGAIVVPPGWSLCGRMDLDAPPGAPMARGLGKELFLKAGAVRRVGGVTGGAPWPTPTGVRDAPVWRQRVAVVVYFLGFLLERFLLSLRLPLRERSRTVPRPLEPRLGRAGSERP